jgi:acyl carrier protein
MTDLSFEASPSLEDVERLIIDTLHLDEVGIETIDPDGALFRDGLGLDSIDALELSLAISKTFGVAISAEDPKIREIFSSLRNLTDHIQRQRPL